MSIQHFSIDNSISVLRFQPNFGFGGGQNPNQRVGGPRPGFNPQQQQQFGGFQNRPQQGFQQRPQQGFQQRPQQGIVYFAYIQSISTNVLKDSNKEND